MTVAILAMGAARVDHADRELIVGVRVVTHLGVLGMAQFHLWQHGAAGQVVVWVWSHVSFR